MNFGTYKKHLKKLTPEYGGKLTCIKGEDINEIRSNLEKAAEDLKIGDLIIIQRNTKGKNTLYFYRSSYLTW